MMGNTVAFFVSKFGMAIICGIEMPKEVVANTIKLNEVALYMGTNYHIVYSAQGEIAYGLFNSNLVRTKHHIGFCLCCEVCSLHPVAVFTSVWRKGYAIFRHQTVDVATREAFEH